MKKGDLPARPSYSTIGYLGFTQRDEIAMRAMAAILSAGQPIGTETLAERAYQIADAMLKVSQQ